MAFRCVGHTYMTRIGRLDSGNAPDFNSSLVQHDLLHRRRRRPQEKGADENW